MTTRLDSGESVVQASRMTPESPNLPDLVATIARHRLAAEAAADPAASPVLASLLASGRDAAVAKLGDQLLEGVRAWLTTAGVVDPEDQDPYLEALAEALALRDEVTPELPLDLSGEDDDDDDPSLGTAIAGEDYELPGSYLVAATPEGAEADAWFIPMREPAELVN